MASRRSLGAVTAATVARRVGAGGLIGLGAGLLLGFFDGLGAARAAGSGIATGRFILWVTLTVCGVLSALGLVQGGLAAALRRLARRLAGVPAHRLGRLAATARDQEASPLPVHREVFRWFGRLVALVSLPAVAWVCSQVFSGPRAQRIPLHHTLSLLLGVLLLVGVNKSVQTAVRARAWVLGATALGPRLVRTLLGVICSVWMALGLLHLDRVVLPRLYPWFHLSLAVLSIAAAQIAMMLIGAAIAASLGTAPRTPGAMAERRPARRKLPWVTLLPLVGVAAAVGAGGFGLARLARAQVLRGLALEHTLLCSYVLRVEAVLHHRAVPPPPPPVPVPSSDAEATAPLWTGARLTGRDVFLITVDALRADRLRAGLMPATQKLAEQGIRFERAYTQVPHTSFAVATLLTGKPVYALLTLGQDAASHETLPTVLRRFRYKTAAFYPPSVFFVEQERLKALQDAAYGFEYVKFEYLDGARRTDQVLHFLDEEKPQRVFVWVHYLEPHEPYDVHPGGPPASAPDRDRYDGEVHFVDGEIERLVSYVRKTRPGALIVIAADHGEEFGEHGGRYHGTSLYEEQAHVPLVFTELPVEGAAPLLRPRQLAEPVGLIDVAPTLLGLLDIERSARMRGRDLSPWLLSGSTTLPTWPVFSEIGRKKLVVLGTRKLMCDFATDTCQSYDLARDPAERNNLIDAEPAEAQRLRGHLDRFIAEARRFEQTGEPAGAGAKTTSAGTKAGYAAILNRARMGDRAALPELARLLRDAQATAEQRRDAVAQLAQLVAAAVPVPAGSGSVDPLRQDAALLGVLRDGELHRQLVRELDDAPDAGAGSAESLRARRWAAIALARLLWLGGEGEARLGEQLAALLRDPQGDAEQKLAAALVLGQSAQCAATATRAREDCLALLLGALPSVMGPGGIDDPDRVRPLLYAIAAYKDPRAVPALAAELEVVRSRADVAAALGETGQLAALPVLRQLLERDPYVHVRAAAATALGRLGGPAAKAALVQASAHEHEEQVATAIKAALAVKPPPVP